MLVVASMEWGPTQAGPFSTNICLSILYCQYVYQNLVPGLESFIRLHLDSTQPEEVPQLSGVPGPQEELTEEVDTYYNSPFLINE